MPTVTIESFSSEDPKFPASNLLAKDTTHKWKCRDVGEESAFVVFRLDGPVYINGIDIGNEHSAFVEVLVGRSGPACTEFREMLLTSTFMSEIESRNSANSGRVSFFTAKQLVEPVAKERWDLVKVVCRQPFNCRVKYGLAFVKLYTVGGEKKDKTLVPAVLPKEIQKKEPSKGLQLGRLKLRGRIYASKPVATPVKTAYSTAAAIRDASTPAAIRSFLASPYPAKMIKITPKPKSRLFDDEAETTAKPRDRNRLALLYDIEDDKPNEKLERKLAIERARKQREKDATDGRVIFWK